MPQFVPDPRARRIAGALTTGLTVAAWEAIPGLILSGRARVAARLGLLAASIPVVVAVAPGRSLAFGNASDTEHDRHAQLAESASALADPRLALTATAGVLAAAIGMSAAESRGKQAILRLLAERGVARPSLVLAVGAGTLAAVVAYLDETKRA